MKKHLTIHTYMDQSTKAELLPPTVSAIPAKGRVSHPAKAGRQIHQIQLTNQPTNHTQRRTKKNMHAHKEPSHEINKKNPIWSITAMEEQSVRPMGRAMRRRHMMMIEEQM
jgi:hypothetical protein